MRTLVLALLLSIAGASARADVIMGAPPSPPSCVRGARAARPDRGHGYYCAAAPECTTGSDCPSGLCEDTAICILDGSDTAPYECGEDGSCFSGTCSRARRCIAPPPPAPPPAPPPPAAALPAAATPPAPAPAAPAPAATSSCHAGRAGDTSIALLVLFAALAGFSRRRR